MSGPEDVIRAYVEAVSAADGDTAATLTTDEATIELPDGAVLKGKEGARQFAGKHAEIDGRRQSVTLTSLDASPGGHFLATLVMTSREVATDEVLYSMDVGGVFEVHDGLVTRNRVFPSPEEATAAAHG